ncbi:peptidoglycan editing factor PgeF [Novosphingobium sp. 1949]|uniref:Purine nucleoside phosphorylase n=1 Tax=Novosphingobium organovorum TaxID=2930092 RepID=A0ABT0B9G4_9SPHN|nr:peptidoglycan editing factor PgeF [Novosphingobium organovorum]MCJ2181503.1 peptidoglycan editing factor PgeF [Novosphingobium organovorum]
MNAVTTAEPVDVARARALADLEGIAHGFLGRRGGVSNGEVAGLNVGYGAGDDRAAVEENRARVVAAVLPGATLATLYQVHSADCVTVSDPIWSNEERPRADALVTNRPGVLLGILTADCAPVLLADREAGVVGAAHAGWKGAFGGVTDRTVAVMEALGARREAIVAAVGPCIARRSYEVDEAFFRRFVEAAAANEAFFGGGREGHYQFDLEAYVAARLAASGVTRIETLGLDTYSAPERYFSFRRATHKAEANYGRQISVIGLT